MDLGIVFRRLADSLDATAVPYMLTGSFASSYYEALRATQDIDVVIAPTAEQLQKLIQHLQGQDYYADSHAAVPAYREQSMFNVFDNQTGWKIDFIFLKSRPFSQEEFRRRKATTFQGVPLFVATAEDVALAKLEWAKIGESTRQIDDVAALLKKQRGNLDIPYIEAWVKQLALNSQWEKAQRMAMLE
jgi:hypothetical protein